MRSDVTATSRCARRQRSRECGDERHFVVEQKEQIANFADFCNHCGNCDTFCPEWDGPYLKKPNFFGSRESFDAAAPHDGFFLEGEPGRFTLHGRIEGKPCRLEQKGTQLFTGNELRPLFV